MHTEENETLFGAESLTAIPVGGYAFLGKDGGYDFYFVKRTGTIEYAIKRVDRLTDSDISDRMWEDFDAHDAWVDAVRNGDTDESYESWQQDIDIWEEMTADDFYGCNSNAIDILQTLGYWNSEYADDDGYYLAESQTWTLQKPGASITLDNLFNRFDDENFNQKLRDDLERKYCVHQIEFLAAEPIR